MESALPRTYRRAARAAAALALVLGLAWLVAPGARAASCLSSPLTVTKFADSASTPGTLRYLVAHACPGASIGFANHTQVALKNVLALDQAVTVRGGALAGGKLLVHASHVTIEDMSLSNTPILIGPANGPTAPHLDGVSVLGSTLAVNDKTLGEAILADGTDNLTIGTSSAANTFQTLTKIAVSLDLNGAVSVVGNSFDTGPGSQHNVAIAEQASSDLTISGNKSDGDIFAEPAKGHIENNTINEAGAAAAAGPGATPITKIFQSGLGLAVQGTSYTAGGRLVVRGNTVTNAGIVVEREDALIASNKISGGATGLEVTCGSKDVDNRGSIVITGNSVTQTIPGLRYICTIRQPSATIKGNTLTANDARGMELTTKQATVSVNNVLSSGTKGSPNKQPAPGIQIDAPGGTKLTLSGNHTNSNTGDGILVGMGAVAGVSAGESYTNGQAGIYVAPNAKVSISRVSFLHNTGPGIDLDPRAVTPNGQTKNGNHSIDWPVTDWNQTTQHIEGTTCPSCLVEGFSREPLPWTGNPDNGEGQTYVANVTADAAGHFTWPPSVPTCTAALNYTFTATQPGATTGGAVRITSEFSPPPTCPPGTCPTGASSCCPTGSTSCCPAGSGTGCCTTGQSCCTSGTTGCCTGGSPGCCETGTTCCTTGSASCTPQVPLGSCPSAGNCTFTLGSNLSANPNFSMSSQQDTSLWSLAYLNPVAGLLGPVLSKGTMPYTGQIIAVRVKGIAIPNGGPGDPGPLTQIHFQDLQPQGNGTLKVIATSQPFNLPDSGDPNQVTTFMPTNLCVSTGDYLGFNDEGGYDPTYYKQGVPFQIFSNVSGPSFAFFTLHLGTGNGAGFPLAGMPGPIAYATPNASPVANQELLMQWVLATGPDETTLCPGGTKGQPATPGGG